MTDLQRLKRYTSILRAAMEDKVKTSTSTPHFLFLDCVRGLAAFYVVMNHASQPVVTDGRLAFKFVHALFGGGHYAVDMFIVLSGFSLGIPVWTGKYDGFRRYICRRAVRIIPPYFITCVICLILIYTAIDGGPGSKWENTARVTATGLITHLFLIHDWTLSSGVIQCIDDNAQVDDCLNSRPVCGG